MTLPDFSIEGLNAVVTGATRGIGRAVAEVLAEAGANVCVTARDANLLEEVASRVRERGVKAAAIPADVTDQASVDAMARRALDELGHVDILVNNAGVVVVKPMVPLPGYDPSRAPDPGFIEPYSESDWNAVINTNLKGAYLCLRAFGPHMLERRRGKIINMSSVNAVKAAKYRFTYDVSKAGLTQLTRSMAVEWAPYNINVNAIGAGYVRTDLNEELFANERLRAKLLSGIPLRRFATVREVALLTVYLASPASDYVTGQTIFLDGGSTA